MGAFSPDKQMGYQSCFHCRTSLEITMASRRLNSCCLVRETTSSIRTVVLMVECEGCEEEVVVLTGGGGGALPPERRSPVNTSSDIRSISLFDDNTERNLMTPRDKGRHTVHSRHGSQSTGQTRRDGTRNFLDLRKYRKWVCHGLRQR